MMKYIFEKNRKYKKSTDEDFFETKTNWRTAYKFNKFCVICESEENLEMHHVNPIRKAGIKNIGFNIIMSNINRKQIVICKECHKKIYSGQYDGIQLKKIAEI